YNNIIKEVLHSNGSLCDLVKTLDSRLEKEAEWNYFFEYQTLSICVGIASVSSEILPAVDYILLEYLMPQILSIEHIEMAQCLYFDATLVNLSVIGLDNKNENVDDQFTEDVYDAKQILLKSMISKVDQINIKETWQITDKRPGNSQRKHFVIVLDSISYMCTCMSNISHGILCQHYFQVMLVSRISGFHIGIVVSRWYCNSKKKKIDQENVIFANSDASEAQQAISNRSAAARRSKFGEIWGLARQAVQLAIECDDNDMELWLKCFINQKKHLLIQNEEPKDSDDSKDSKKENNSTIKNPAITKYRGRPATKRFKAATEKPRHQTYTCRSCGKTRHNSARCQKKGG
ncbi:12050_t:CDS:2, partial [Dentiscutata heterogama]